MRQDSKRRLQLTIRKWGGEMVKEKTWQPQSVKVTVLINHLTGRRDHHV
jgi:hypothetical protein